MTPNQLAKRVNLNGGVGNAYKEIQEAIEAGIELCAKEVESLRLDPELGNANEALEFAAYRIRRLK